MRANSLIHIVDADPAICEALSLLFRLEGFETAFSLNSEHFISAIKIRPPHVAVIDLRASDYEGVSLVKRARLLCSGMPAIMLSDFGYGADTLEKVVRAMLDGAMDVMQKPVDHEKLLAKVRTALGTNIQISTAHNGRREVKILGFPQLTKREREVLELIVGGKSNKAVANQLEISFRTVEAHRSKVMQKLHAANTADLIRITMSG